ncbi:MAG TPA: DoxX family protein [Vicinamibacterales bacterium]|jgi:uncharacterized membrane protein YphA (DoxX/SURF4 family)|nr:DoxX family protein [Vicinamibacterales bacterium]
MTVKRNVALWVVQGLLALLFVFAGGAKFVMSVEQMQQGGVALPGWFLHFIGACEVVGGLGLVLPGIFRIKEWLTPLAAALLEVIMVGAVTLSWYGVGFTAAILPLVTGIGLAFVLFGRR